MRKLAAYFAVMIFATEALAASAQSSEKTEPQFTLTISEYHHEFGPGFDRIMVRETNISQAVIYDPGCQAERGWITLSVLYNGVLLKEKDKAARLRREKDANEFCTFGGGVSGIKPGESKEYLISLALEYDVSRPGTYDVTASMASDRDHPEKSVTVKSNTLTVVVPEPGAAEPK